MINSYSYLFIEILYVTFIVGLSSWRLASMHLLSFIENETFYCKQTEQNYKTEAVFKETTTKKKKKKKFKMMTMRLSHNKTKR